MNQEPAAQDILSNAILDAARQAGLCAQTVSGLKRLTGGASKETWAFDLTLDGGLVQQLVLRRQSPDQRFSALGLSSVSAEAAIIRIAAAAGVPVPGVPFELPDGSIGGDGYAMERVAGETVGARILKMPELADARTDMARHCGEILARLHSAKGYETLNLEKQGAREAIDALEIRHQATRQDRPVFELALHWLKENLPDKRSCTLLHGDFRNGNLVVGPDGIRSVLDWELAHIGPAAYDLAWLCIPSWRFQRPELIVGGFGTREALIEGYERAGGVQIDRAELHAWEVFQTMNWGVMCASAATAFMGGDSRNVEGGVIARRASETEFDLMRYMAPDHEAWDAR